MRLINPRYSKLHPTSEYLGDEVIMVQAWKKTHAYIRTHNWYADTLALDVSALSLERSVKSWASAAVDTAQKLEPMELVPAAKSERWTVTQTEGWVPKKNIELRQKDPPLRPLAHLTIRDQTWASAAMLCLADIVETAQGDCSDSNVFLHQRRGVYSYGNRLLCDWKDDGKAWFRWGNSQIYRKFFTDYQTFLRRPVLIGREVAESHAETDNVYVVSLDLSKFYDKIDRRKLRLKLKRLCEHEAPDNFSEDFWTSFEKITDWQWGSADEERARKLNLVLAKGKGIPQGLVSAGFYANAYLLEFDRAVGKKIGELIPEKEGITLHDYCRYVDDLRLVVSIEKKELYRDISSSVTEWLNEVLEAKASSGLNFNEAKTAVTALSDLDNKGSLSERVAQLQSDLSGPADRDVLDGAMGALEGLITMSSEGVPAVDDTNPDAELVRIAKFDHDVRTDTLKRFAANRLETIMRNKRKIDGGAGHETAQEIDNQSELLAKKLIWAWMQDPSLALVLRKALEIYPSDSIAEPIFEALYSRCSFTSHTPSDTVSSAMADYLIADLFRSCIDLHGYFQRVEYPRTSNPDQLLELACRFAQKVMSSEDVPDYVERQALLLLAVKQKPAPIPEKPHSIHQFLHAILAGKEIPWKHQLLALYEIASQITGLPGSFATQCLESTEKLGTEQQKVVLDELAKRSGPLWSAIWDRLPKSKIDTEVQAGVEWATTVAMTQPRSNTIYLDRLFSAKDNPFLHEASLIRLALGLIDELQKREGSAFRSPAHIQVIKPSKVSWSKLCAPDSSFRCSMDASVVDDDPRFMAPDWLDDQKDAREVYWIGCILRSAAVGATDYTGNRWRSSKVQSYKGLRTGWYKRRMGMMHAPEALVGEFATLSTWAAELLMKCLQWPGFESTYLTYGDIKAFDSIESLKSTLADRLKFLNGFYCEGIATPALVTKCGRPDQRHEQGFRLVSVQQLLPRASDFTKADPMLENPIVRSANRDHLSRICQITYKTLLAKLEAEEKTSYPGADLIVFPELSVHPDDQDLIKQLADKTRSMIFAGLSFQDHDGKLINVARWFIPDYRVTGRQWVIRDQGKKNPMKDEKPLGVIGYRPCQHILEIEGDSEGPYFISGAICYDSTDLKLATDLKDKTDLFIIAAHNKDVRTFDAMASALNYHMYQHVVVVNKGEYGGSTIQAPYREQYDRLISHSHGTDQISINVADLDLAAFKRRSRAYKSVKTPPAGT